MGKLVVFSGAGLSADSGIQTFRGTSGLWEGVDIDKVCNALTWRSNYNAVHDFYNARRVDMTSKLPNAAHKMIATWQSRYETVILTQNIDDLLEQVGCTDVVHLHGRINDMKCEACGHTWQVAPGTVWKAGEDSCPRDFGNHVCGCKKAIKPGVVFFNEDAPNYRHLYNMIRDLTADDVIVVIGTTSRVIPIGSMISEKPGYRILNNLHETDDFHEKFTYQDKFYMTASEAAPLIDEKIRERLG